MNDSPNRLRLRSLMGLVAASLLSACTTVEQARAPDIDRQATWAMLGFANHTETPLAGQRAEAIAEALLYAQGVSRIRRQPTRGEALFDGGSPARDREEALAWARSIGARYALTGSVDEWRYKVGVDGEPAVGLSLMIIDVGSSETLWSGVGGKSGWTRESLAAVAQQLMRSLLAGGLAGKGQ